MTSTRVLTRAAVFAASVVLLAGCGSDGDDSASSGKGSAKTCADASPATINEVLGTTFGEPESLGEDDVIVCTYRDSKTNYAGTIRFHNNSSHSIFTAGRSAMDSSGQKTTDVSDVGDEAYSSSFKASDLVPELNTVAARKGSTEISISTMTSLDKNKELANRLLD
jgi:hypothetical protein